MPFTWNYWKTSVNSRFRKSGWDEVVGHVISLHTLLGGDLYLPLIGVENNDVTSGERFRVEDIPSGLVFWNRLGNVAELEIPEVGTPLVYYPPVTIAVPHFAPAKYGNGYMNYVMSNSYLKATYNNPLTVDNFTIEFWWKPEESSIYTFPNNYYSFVTITPDDLNNQIIFRKTQEAIDKTFRLRIINSGSIVMDYTFTSPSYSANDLIHLAVTLESSALSGEKIKMYADGSPLSRASYSDGAYSISSPRNIYIGKILPLAAGTYTGGLVDNFKIWNYVKTDFSDRNIEPASFPVLKKLMRDLDNVDTYNLCHTHHTLKCSNHFHTNHNTEHLSYKITVYDPYHASEHIDRHSDRHDTNNGNNYSSEDASQFTTDDDTYYNSRNVTVHTGET